MRSPRPEQTSTRSSVSSVVRRCGRKEIVAAASCRRPFLDLDQRPVGRVFELEVGKMCERLGSEVRKHDPLSFKLFTMCHHLPIRDMSRVLAVEVRGLADEEV